MSDLIQKVVDRPNVGEATGGLLNTAQTDKFIDYMWDQSVLAKEARTVRMKSDTADIDKLGVGRRIAKLATEAVDTGVNAAVQFTKVSITTKKIRLDWEISTEAKEDNIEGDSLADHIARILATQFGNDLEDLAINGDTTSSDPLLKAFDGWHKRSINTAHVVSGAGQTLNRAQFNTALKTMPRNFMQRRGDLKFYTGSNAMQDYLYSLTDKPTTPEDIVSDMIRNGPVRTSGPAGFVMTFAFGVPVTEVPLYEEDLRSTISGQSGDFTYLDLTFPKNRLWGIKREIQVYSEFKPKKDTTEYTVFTRTGVQIEEATAWVVVKDIKIAA